MNGQNNNRRALSTKVIQIGKEAKLRPWLWGAVLFFLVVQAMAMATGNSGGMILFGFLVLLTTSLLILSRMRKSNRVVQDWAIEESQKQRIAGLTGSTTDELEEMVQYHLSKGHIQEADTISRRLMDMVDGSEQSPAANSPAQDEGYIVKTSTGLPNWLAADANSDGLASPSSNTQSPGHDEKDKDAKLPSWLDKN